MNRRLSLSLATVLAVALLATACTDPKEDVAASAEAATPTSAFSNDWGLGYVGGTEGKADSSLEPIVIGYVNQEGGVPAFPEATAGTEAAVAYINEELGGIDGHPLELKTCLVQAEDDGQKCGTEFVNDPNVRLVLSGVLTVGAESLYKVVIPKLPVISGNPVTIPEFLTNGAVALTPGSPGVIQGLAVFIANHLSTSAEPIESVAVVYGDNDGAKAAVTSLFTPVLNQLGITDIKAVPVADTATAPDLQAALQASGAADADVVVSLVTLPLCIATYDALKALGITPTVVTTGLCLGTAMTKHLEDVGDSGDVPDGWYFGDYGYSYFMPDEESGMTTYLAKVAEYGENDVEYTGFAGPQFANVMTIAKFFNAIGPETLSADAINEQISSFEGPMMLVAGPMACGEVSPTFVTLCGRQIGIEQYADGKWKSVADALNGKPIDPASELAQA